MGWRRRLQGGGSRRGDDIVHFLRPALDFTLTPARQPSGTFYKGGWDEGGFGFGVHTAIASAATRHHRTIQPPKSRKVPRTSGPTTYRLQRRASAQMAARDLSRAPRRTPVCAPTRDFTLHRDSRSRAGSLQREGTLQTAGINKTLDTLSERHDTRSSGPDKSHYTVGSPDVTRRF